MSSIAAFSATLIKKPYITITLLGALGMSACRARSSSLRFYLTFFFQEKPAFDSPVSKDTMKYASERLDARCKCFSYLFASKSYFSLATRKNSTAQQHYAIKHERTKKLGAENKNDTQRKFNIGPGRW